MELNELGAKYLVQPSTGEVAEKGPARDWKQRSVADIAARTANAIVGGPFGSDLVSRDYVAFGVPVIRGQNMSRALISGEFVFVSLEKAKSLAANLAQPDDLIFTQRGTLGQVSVVPKSPFKRYLVSQSQMKLTVNTLLANPDYVYHYFNSAEGQRQIFESAIQTGVPHTNLGILRSYKVPVPPTITEQQEIARALSDADALIESLEQLLAKKRQIKQGAMQELLTGQRRLPGFSGAWVNSSIGELLTIRHGRDQKSVASDSGDYPVLATGGQIGWATAFLHDKPSVLIGRKGTIDEPRYMDTPFWTVDTLFYSEVHEPNCAKFLFYRFCLIDWMRHNEASGVPSLNAKVIEALEIEHPAAEEQTAIVTVLSDMDTEITALEARLSKARHLKQGMAQALLTGRIRLVPRPEAQAS